MKSLVEGLFGDLKQLDEGVFGDNITKDPFESIIDRMDPEKYSPDDTLKALETLFTIGGKRYGFFSAGSKREAFLKAIRKNDWLMLARKNHDLTVQDYVFISPDPRDNGYLDKYTLIWKGFWYLQDIDIGYSINSEYGSFEIMDRCANMGYDECILITDKKMKNELLKTLKKLARK